jgi:Homeodomain-like domain-containing protein
VDASQDLEEVLSQWQIDPATGRARMSRAPPPRERERWHALWRALHGWPTVRGATALGRAPHTVGSWRAALRRDGPGALAFRHTGGSPPP